LAGAGVLALLVTGVAIAQVSPSFDLSWSTLASGGGERSSAQYLIQDTVGQAIADVSGTSTIQVAGGFMAGIAPSTAQFADAYEVDDTCAQAKAIDTSGGKQTHNFQGSDDTDWIKFTAQANQTYIIEVNNVGVQANAIIALHDTCATDPAGFGGNAFGSTVQLDWDSSKKGDYFLALRSNQAVTDPQAANYEISVRVDNVPPSSPTDPRCINLNATTLGVQWKKSPEIDVRRYRVALVGDFSKTFDVLGGNTTYLEAGELTPNLTYGMRVLAVDYSNNESSLSGEVRCTVRQPSDTTQPAFSLAQPGNGTIYTTTAGLLTFTGSAQDAGGNLSRAYVRNTTKNVEGWDYSLTGGSDDFRVQDLSLGYGDNQVQVAIYDAAGNVSQQSVLVRRLGSSSGAVMVIAGHNESFALQTNIYNLANRAVRIFKMAGFTDENIYYLAPIAQDADGDGATDVDATSTPAAIQNALTGWAKQDGRVGPGKPLFIYLVDHGFEEYFCVNGCGPGGKMTADDLDNWLRTLETETGLDTVSIVIEACRSGSFVDRFNGDVENSLSKAGRVVITSTSREKNAYASPEGALFSDAFFSCLADSNTLKVCYDQGKAAVLTTGISQLPWLDDNGDALADANDGAVAQSRYVTRFFSSIRPQITATNLDQQGANGVLTAQIQDGAEQTTLVWATIFPPGYQEPTDVTQNLAVPVVRLEPDPAQAGRYLFNYQNGFGQDGAYRIVFYAQDRLGIQATPKLVGESIKLYLPFATKQ